MLDSVYLIMCTCRNREGTFPAYAYIGLTKKNPTNLGTHRKKFRKKRSCLPAGEALADVGRPLLGGRKLVLVKWLHRHLRFSDDCNMQKSARFKCKLLKLAFKFGLAFG